MSEIVSAFETVDFSVSCDGREYIGRLIYFEKSVVIWVSNAESRPSLENLAVSMTTPYDSMPLSSVLVSNGVGDDNSCGIGARLAKKFNIQVFMSYNVHGEDENVMRTIERKLISIISEKT